MPSKKKPAKEAPAATPPKKAALRPLTAKQLTRRIAADVKKLADLLKNPKTT